MITHLRHNAIAYVALIAALSTGTAYAAGKITGADIAKNAVKAKHIKNGQVRGAELATDAVSGDKVAANSITGADVDESTLVGLGGGTGGTGSPGPSAPGPNSVGSAEVEDDSLTGEDVDESTLAGLPRVVAQGFIGGVGPLGTSTRCKSIVTDAAGVKISDQVVITPGSLTAEVVFTGVAGTDTVTYQACYTGSSGVNLAGDVRYLVLRGQ